jgi:hypothetical protein
MGERKSKPIAGHIAVHKEWRWQSFSPKADAVEKIGALALPMRHLVIVLR